MRRIVHISGDFPDSVNPHKTPVIRSLTRFTRPVYDQTIYSLNRHSPSAAFVKDAFRCPWRPKLRVDFHGQDDDVVPIVYRAPGSGLFHASMLDQLADDIADHVLKGPDVALIIGYKLTIEGLIARKVAQRTRSPFGILIQGNTDKRIIQARPDLRSRFRDIYHSAAVVFSTSPWALSYATRMLGERTGDTHLLPCPTDQDRLMAPVAGKGALTTAFHLRNYRIKNFGGLAGAVARALPQAPELHLDVLGHGTVAERREVERAVPLSAKSAIMLKGAIPHREMQMVLHGSRGFVLPSVRETFGLVFIEALLAGCPVVYPAGAAIDGYFDSNSFAIAVDPRDTSALSEALLRLWREESILKQSLHSYQMNGRLTQFTRISIKNKLIEGIRKACGPPGCVPHDQTISR
jgi:glycosyltransferase involved in cell wall biosynthesis